jgi:hypothetical protein
MRVIADIVDDSCAAICRFVDGGSARDNSPHELRDRSRQFAAAVRPGATLYSPRQLWLKTRHDEREDRGGCAREVTLERRELLGEPGLERRVVGLGEPGRADLGE